MSVTCGAAPCADCQSSGSARASECPGHLRRSELQRAKCARCRASTTESRGLCPREVRERLRGSRLRVRRPGKGHPGLGAMLRKARDPDPFFDPGCSGVKSLGSLPAEDAGSGLAAELTSKGLFGILFRPGGLGRGVATVLRARIQSRFF